MKRRLRDLTDPVVARRRSHPTRNGAILVTLAALIIVGGVLHRLPIIEEQTGYTITADFAKVNQVNNRTPVRVRGVDVGLVTGEDPGPDPRRTSQLTMVISDSSVVVHQDASASIRWRTVLGGSMYIDLNPGSDGAPRLKGPIPASRNSSQVELDDILRIYNGNTDQLQRDTLKGLSQGFGAPAPTGRSVDALPDLTTVGSGVEPYKGTEAGDLAHLVATTATTAQALGASVSSLQTLVTGAERTVGALDAQHRALGQMLSLSPGTLDSTYTTMNRLRITLGHLDPLVTNLQPGARLIASTSTAMMPALRQTQAVLDQSQSLLHSARPALRDLRATSVLGTPVLRGLLPTLNRLNTNILPWLNQRDSDTRVVNYDAIGPFFSVLDKAAAEYDESGHRLHLSTLLGSASVIDEPTLSAATKSMQRECRLTAKPNQQSDCPAVTSVLLGALYGGQK